MTKCPRILLTITLLALVLGTHQPAVKAGPSIDGTRLTSADEQGVQFVVQVPWQDLSLESVDHEAQKFTRVSLPGWETSAEAGTPELPAWIEMIGVPFNAEVSITVITGKAHEIKLEHPVLPGVGLRVEQPQPDVQGDFNAFPDLTYYREMDQSIYENQQDYPGVLGKVVNDGVLRQQRVAGVAVYPVQYHIVTNTLTIYETLHVTISFKGGYEIEREIVTADQEVYEGIYEGSLLNYESARDWRLGGGELWSPEAVEIGVNESFTPTISGWVPPEQSWRIAVSEEGMYQLNFDELSAAGVLDASPDPRNFHIYHLGEAIAIQVIGEEDGIFNSADRIIFYGQGINDKYTDKNIYWLSIGETAGLRMDERSGMPDSGTIPGSFTEIKEFEQNLYYSSLIPGDDTVERFMWNYVYAPSRPSWTYPFNLTAPLVGEAQLTITLMGYLNNIINPDHHVKIYLNDNQIGEDWWDGLTLRTITLDVSGLLVPGTNTLQVTCPNDTGVGYDVVYVDKFVLSFPSSFVAEDNKLRFDHDAPGDWLFEVDGFSSDQVSVFDISHPSLVERITDVEVITSGAGFAARFEDHLDLAKSYLALENDTYHTVDTIVEDDPSNLQAVSGEIDQVIISHEIFMQAAQDLADFRSGQGLDVMLVDMQDVYDEFGYGITGAQPIREFLAYAYTHWNTAYVLLIGDGHYDPKNYLVNDRESYIPPYLAFADPWIGETAADNRYVTLVGEDTMPDMMIGRLSVNSTEEAGVFISKIKAYEQNQDFEDWKYQVLAVADNADSGGNFPQLSDNLLNDQLPSSFTAEKVYHGLTHPTTTESRLAIMAGINSGKLLINYIGHAAYTLWADEGLFRTTDVPTLTNGDKLPVILAMTCYEGFFHKPDKLINNKEALAEVVTRAANGGAIASWSPTGLGLASGHDALNRGFYDAYFTQGRESVGEAILSGKLRLWMTGSNLDLLDTYTLFGDPALKITRSIKAVDDSYQTSEDVPLSIGAGQGLLVNDLYPSELTPTVELVSGTSNGSSNLALDGSFTYSPNHDWFGTDSFTYRLDYGQGYSNTAYVEIQVIAVNDAPVAYDQKVSTQYDTPIQITLTASDDNFGSGPYRLTGETDPSSVIQEALLTFEILTDPQNGSLNLALPVVTYTPTAGFVGMDSFTFKVNDGVFDSNVATVRILVIGAFQIYLPLVNK